MRWIPAILIAFVLAACTEDPTAPRIIQPAEEWARFSLVQDLGDSLVVRAKWILPSDPSGVDSTFWQNWGISLGVLDTLSAWTVLDSADYQLRKPALGITDSYRFAIQHIDGAGNIGARDSVTWHINNRDTEGPPAGEITDPIDGDTLFVTSVDTLFVWPDSATIEVDAQAQFYVAVLFHDRSVACDPPPAAPGALWDSGTFCCGCDSAIAKAHEATILKDLQLPETWQIALLDRSRDPFLWRREG